MPRVVLYASRILPVSSTAVGVRCFHLAEAMRAEGISVDVWTHSRNAGERTLFLPFSENRWPNSLRMIHEAVAAVELAARLLWLRTQGADTVVVLSSPPFVTCFLVATFCRAIGLRYVWDARDVYPEVLFNLGVVKREGAFGRWLTRRTRAIYERALLVSAPSDAFVRVIRDQVGASCVVSTVRNGFDERLFAPADRSGASPEEFVCVNHGLIGRMHNIQLILDVAALVEVRAPAIQFVIIGSGPKEDLLRDQPRSNVRYLGAKPYAEIPAFLSAADLGLAFIDGNEGADGAFPVKLYEFVGAGLPSVVTPHSEAGRLVEARGIGCAFRNDEAPAIAERIIELSRRGPEYEALRRRTLEQRLEFGRSRASREFARLLGDRMQPRAATKNSA